MQKNPILKRLMAVSIAAAMFGAVGAQAQTGQSSQAGQQSGSSATSATASGAAKVKAFATKMVDDHGKALTEVQTLAQSKGVTLPTELDAKHKAMSAKLEKMSGDAFDKAYVKQGGLGAHKETLTKLQAASKGAKDPEVKGQVDKMIPVVQEHLKHAEQLAQGKSGSSGSSGAAGHTGSSH